MNPEAHKLIESFERDIASGEARGNIETLDMLLHEKFEEVGTSGRVSSKKDILAILPGQKDKKYVLKDFSFIDLCDECILVKYSTQLGKLFALRASVWVREGKNWKLLHHQSTAIPD